MTQRTEDAAIRDALRGRTWVRGSGWAKVVVAVALGAVAGATLFARKADGGAVSRKVEES